MWNLIIIDDEPKVRNGLSKIIKWESFGFEVGGVFSNGREALAYLNDNDVDLVITDIKMPVMNGIDLIKSLRRGNNITHILILSGFDDYEYLKQAIHFNVDSYLLKPINIEELKSNLDTIAKQLQQEETSSRFLNEGIEALRNSLCQRIVQNKVSEQELSNKLQFLQANSILNWESYTLGVMRLIDFHNSRLLQPNDNDQRKLLNILDSITGHEKLLFVDREQLPVIIARDEVILERITNTFVYKVKQNLRAKLVCFGGSNVDNILDLHNVYYSVYENMFMTDPSDITSAFVASEKEWNSDLNHNVSRIPMNEVDRALHNGDEEELQAILHLIIDENEDKQSISRCLFSTVMYIVSSLQRAVKDSHSLYDQLHINPQDFASLNTKVSLQAYIDTFCHRLKEIVLNRTRYTGNTIVDNLIRYIHSHYGEGISLKEYACSVDMNPTYIGKIFVEKTGQKFTQYVQDVKVEKACILLRETPLKISEIADKTGFSDSHYFLKIFQTRKGCTPGKYRNSLSR